FQAEDGIRDFHVTGVQTCALPICSALRKLPRQLPSSAAPCRLSCRESCGAVSAARNAWFSGVPLSVSSPCCSNTLAVPATRRVRSEERRVGKEWRCGWCAEH